jgi:hypothetical protein
MSVTFTLFSETGGWLDVPDASIENGVQVQRYDLFHGGANQQWVLVEMPEFEGEFYQIRSAHSGLVLDVLGSEYNNNIPIIQFPATGNDNQLWRFVRFPQPDRTGFVYLIHPRRSQKLMEVAADGMVQLHDDRGEGANSAWLVQAGNLSA